MVSYRAGELDQSVVDRLYDEAKVVLFPSHYEGFGFPAMHALARCKPLIARRQPVFEEIANRSPHAKNIHLFDSTEEMVRFSTTPPPWIAAEAKDVAVQSWSQAAGDLHAAIKKARAKFSFDLLRRRLQHAETLRLLAYDESQRLSLSHQPNPSPASSLLLTIGSNTPPTAPDSDPLRHVGEFVSIRTQLVLGWLGRVSTLRRLGAAFWRTRRHGRQIELVPDADLSPYGAQSVGAIKVMVADSQMCSEVLIRGLLDWAYRLTSGGSLQLVVADPPRDPGAMSPFGEPGLRIWAISAGLEVLSIEQTETGLNLSAAKAVDWAALLSSGDDDAAFVANAFQDAFGREATGLGADHALNQLQAHISRYEVLRHLYSALERGLMIARRYQLRS